MPHTCKSKPQPGRTRYPAAGCCYQPRYSKKLPSAEKGKLWGQTVGRAYAVFLGRPGFLGAAPSVASVVSRGVRALRTLGVATYSSASIVSISASAACNASSALVALRTVRLRSDLIVSACCAVARTFWNSSKLRAMRE